MEFNGTFFVTIISFLIFVFMMNRILYTPVLNIMEARKSYINDNYNTAKENDAESEVLVAKKEEKIQQAKSDARQIYIETVDEYKAQKSDIVTEAQKNAAEELAKSAINLENITNETKEGLKHSMTDLANDIVEKVIGYRSEIQDFDNRTVDEILYQ